MLHWVNPPLAKGMTFTYPFQGYPNTQYHTIPTYGLAGKLRTGRRKTATPFRPEPGSHSLPETTEELPKGKQPEGKGARRRLHGDLSSPP